MEAFERFTYLFEIMYGQVFMRTLCQCLHGEPKLWFRNVEVHTIGSWMGLHDVFFEVLG